MCCRLVAVATFIVLAACGDASGRAPGSGISGRILAGPTCPVERVPPAPGCAPRPLVATLRIARVGSSAGSRSVRSRSDGRFRVSLAPGLYTVKALPQGRAAPLEGALDSLATLRNALLLGVLGGTALAVLLSRALALRALRPLKRIAFTAETIRSDDLARRIGYGGRDELADLAGVLDARFEQLEGSIERQRRFGADASHELKTPLAAIRANVELLRGWGALEPATRESALSSLDQASARASRLSPICFISSGSTAGCLVRARG
jgi:signal transduction histidine kinase